MFNKSNNHSEDQAYLSDVNSANLYGAATRSHIILWLTFSFFIIALIWANFAKLDEVTRGSGKIIPSSHIQVLQNLEGGILSEILVEEGELVEKGQVLLKLDAVRFASSANEAKLKHFELIATTARLTAEVNKKPLKLSAEILKNHPAIADDARKLLKSRQNELKANQRILNSQIRQKRQELTEARLNVKQFSKGYSLAKEELDMNIPLEAEGVISKVEIIRLKRAAHEARSSRDSARSTIPRLKSTIEEAKSKLSELEIRFHTEALEELNLAKAELERSSESSLALDDRVSRTQVISTVKGTIKQLKITTIGGVIQPGMDLIEIVPLDDQLLIQAEIRPADIAFLHPGQVAMIKFTAYDFSIYGGLEAKLEHISPDTIINEEDGESYYLIRLRTDKNYLEKNGAKLNIIAGMIADVDILTGKKSVLDYLLKPILKAQGRALRER